MKLTLPLSAGSKREAITSASASGEQLCSAAFVLAASLLNGGASSSREATASASSVAVALTVDFNVLQELVLAFLNAQ